MMRSERLRFVPLVRLHTQLDIVAPYRAWYAAVHPAHVASIRLLTRLGYTVVSSDVVPHLGSYDRGDVCFVRDCAERSTTI